MDRQFAEHYPRLCAAARRVLGDHALAEEVAADALQRLIGQAVADRPPGEVAAWLQRVTIRLALNRLRSEQRHRVRVTRHGAAHGPLRTVDPGETVLRADERERVRAALAQLPERQASALLLRHAGHTYAEIATALAVAEGSVGVLLARGERAFRRLWEDPGPTGPRPDRTVSP